MTLGKPSFEYVVQVQVYDRAGNAVEGATVEKLSLPEREIEGAATTRGLRNQPVSFRFSSEENACIRARYADWISDEKIIDSNQKFLEFIAPIGKEAPSPINLTISSFALGVVFLFTLLILSTVQENPSIQARQIQLVTLCLSAAGFASGIGGLLTVNLTSKKLGYAIQATGAIAVFVITYFFAPAALK